MTPDEILLYLVLYMGVVGTVVWTRGGIPRKGRH